MNASDAHALVGETDRAAFRAGDVDPRSRERLAESGLVYRRVAVDGDEFAPWQQSVARGFQDGERSDEQIAASRERSAYRRLTGVYDGATPVPEAPWRRSRRGSAS